MRRTLLKTNGARPGSKPRNLSITTVDHYNGIWALQADGYLDGLLLPPEGELEDSAVESVSWGRIKAALEME